MAEFLFVGGPWDGRRREVPVTVDRPDPPEFHGRYALTYIEGMVFYTAPEMIREDAVAALLANYRPHRPTCNNCFKVILASKDHEGRSEAGLCMECARILERLGAETVAAEREACAKMAERPVLEGDFLTSCRDVAAAIRARGEPLVEQPSPKPDAVR